MKTIQDLIQHPEFKSEVTSILDALILKRIHRPTPPPGKKYIRTALDVMRDAGKLDATYFIKHIEAIWKKDSKHLSAQERQFIGAVCESAANKVIARHATLENEPLPYKVNGLDKKMKEKWFYFKTIEGARAFRDRQFPIAAHVYLRKGKEWIAMNV